MLKIDFFGCFFLSLEFISIKKIIVAVKHWDSEAKLATCEARIVDILTKNKEEFLIMSNDIRIRLDRIFEIEIINAK